MIRSLDIVECEVLPVVARLEVSVRRGQIGNPLRSEAAVDVGNFAGRLVAFIVVGVDDVLGDVERRPCDDGNQNDDAENGEEYFEKLFHGNAVLSFDMPLL